MEVRGVLDDMIMRCEERHAAETKAEKQELDESKVQEYMRKMEEIAREKEELEAARREHMERVASLTAQATSGPVTSGPHRTKLPPMPVVAQQVGSGTADCLPAGATGRRSSGHDWQRIRRLAQGAPHPIQSRARRGRVAVEVQRGPVRAPPPAASVGAVSLPCETPCFPAAVGGCLR